LLSLNVLTDRDVTKHDDGDVWQSWYDALAGDNRVETLAINGRAFWVAAERAALVKAAYLLPTGEAPDADDDPEVAQLPAVTEVLRGRVESSGPFSIAEMADSLAIDTSLVHQGLLALEREGLVLRGKFRPNAVDDEYCDRRILARINRATVGKLRKAVEPVPVASLIRFLLEWQHATPGSRLSGDAGMIEVVEQLQGFEAAAAGWESALLPYRLTDYKTSTLDALCFGGELAWGRFARRNGVEQPGSGLSRNGPVSIALREDVEWLLDAPNDAMELRGAAADVRDFLASHGASFMPDIVMGTGRMPSEVEDAIWVLVAAGMVTADGFGALRGLVTGLTKKVQRRSRFTRRGRIGATAGRTGSRWSLLTQPSDAPVSEAPAKVGLRVSAPSEWDRQVGDGDTVLEARAAQLLRRYGIVTRELVAREPMAPPWNLLARAYRRAEARGEVRGGRFVAGLIGEQFALQEAVDAMRAVHRRELTGEVVRISACDPLNLVGIITPGARVPAVLGNEVLYRDGVPILRDATEDATATA
jgi:ATP-dependent Lhr-like helicase